MFVGLRGFSPTYSTATGGGGMSSGSISELNQALRLFLVVMRRCTGELSGSDHISVLAKTYIWPRYSML